MPRFYFDIYDGINIADDEGIEFADLGSARSEAVLAAGDMLKERHETWNNEEWRMQVRDESGAVVATLRFSGQ